MRLTEQQKRERNQQLDHAIATGAATVKRLEVNDPPSAWSDEPPNLKAKLIEQAKLCQTARGAAMLLMVKSYLIDDVSGMDGFSELWQVADHLTSQPVAPPLP